MKSIRNGKDHTYSIATRDPKTGEMGVGLQNHPSYNFNQISKRYKNS